ncbi:MAG: hypothetical protein GTO45_03635 [Candidatus Aminicenantes bacterium]|nr:hypothetical protein [Candidatus Aminicenantes bacterium]NIM77819.1 hypothetical protein [Candidatus Aminicenantes bacterium]NIN17131.1 hypothetical protein [Candidatus Aminicenantes bacterium]NIN41024.1 hypothetical protein [Candidatus Aminicenantes bacterium]NIN83829.1 hypothetical protein [Candidatus Aminicenantes bacterium]
MNKKVFLIVFFLVLILSSNLVSGAIPTQERAALISLYNNTNGDNWTNNSEWKMPPLHTDGFAMPGTEDSWYGIMVSENHVKKIGMVENNLTGSIPPELGNLSNLQDIWLWDNKLTGNIPSELGNLINLSWLYLWDNQLTGSIPSELGNLTLLSRLILSGNQLTGNIPSELGNLINLSWLDLDGNQLIGSIPNSLTNLTNLDTTDISYNALYTNDDTLRTFLNRKDPGWEDTQTIAPTNISAAAISSSSIRVSWTPITFNWSPGGYKVYYSITSGGPWTYSGMTTSKYTYANYYDVTGLNSGMIYYFVVKTQTNPHYYNDNTVVSEYSEEASATTGLLEEKDPPFGSFDTPIHGSTVYSSIPVTGWALDDYGIDSVKIYRKQGNTLVYIGDGVFVEGARPDVADAYPSYPNNTKAGWGYMMLTNFLPNSGNGTFVIHAVVTDVVGKTTTLGTKTIHCDNANAVEPFGAIDTPTQGGIATGSSFINWGWVLTPQPNSIPTDGSTINVWVDGINIGHPTYNIYRPDIATLFPGYANSDGAVGYFYLDTTQYENGVHTIQWTVTDSGSNTDGIGSRYFTIQNTGSPMSGMQVAYSKMEGNKKKYYQLFQISEIPIIDWEPIKIKKGFREDCQYRVVNIDESSIFNIKIKELELIEVELSNESQLIEGYTIVGNQLRPLPIGSTLDNKTSKFYWQPGPGFVGYYHFVFIETDKDGKVSKKNIIVRIEPKFLKSKQ